MNQARSQKEPMDVVTCCDCGEKFDLSRQPYYDEVCPQCMKKREPERTWNSCFKCKNKIPPEDETHVFVDGTARDRGKVKLPAHEECAEEHTPPRPGPIDRP